MALNPNIPLSVQTANPLEAISQSRKVRAQGLNNKTREMAIDEKAQQMEQRSLIDGAIQLNEYLKVGDIDGAKRFTQNRIAAIDARDGNSQQSQDVLGRLEAGDIEGLQNDVNSILSLAQQNGLIGSGSKKVQSSEQVPGGVKVLYSDGSVEFKPLPKDQQQQIISAQEEENQREIELAGAKKEAQDLASQRVSRLGDITDQANKASDQLELLDQLESFDVEQGFGQEFLSDMGRLFSAFGATDAADRLSNVSGVQGYRAVAGKLLAEALSTQKGPQTDQDAARIERTLPRITNEKRANQFIISSMKAVNLRKIERRRFIDDKLDNGATLRKAEREWEQRKRSLPMISDTVTGADGLPTFYYEFKQFGESKGLSDDEIRKQWENAHD